MRYTGLSGKTYELGSTPFSSGGEGEIYEIVKVSDKCAKIYHQVLRSKELEEKLKVMVANPPDQSVLFQIAWPLDIIYSNVKDFVGFIMPKISSLNVKSVIIKFIVKSLALTTASIILISSVASFIIFKLDLDLSYCKYAGYLISALTSFIVPFICLKPFKNNILFLSFLSIIPLVLFSLANFIFFGKEFVQLFISLAIIIAVAFVTGVMSAGKRR